MAEEFDSLNRPLVEPPGFDTLNNVTQPLVPSMQPTGAQAVAEKALEAQKPLMEAQVESTGLDTDLKRQQLERVERMRRSGGYTYDGGRPRRGRSGYKADANPGVRGAEPQGNYGDSWWKGSAEKNKADAQGVVKPMRTAVAQQAVALRARQQAGIPAAGPARKATFNAIRAKSGLLQKLRIRPGTMGIERDIDTASARGGVVSGLPTPVRQLAMQRKANSLLATR